MTILLFGLLLFFGIHLLPAMPRLRGALLRRLGPLYYRAGFSLLAAGGLALVVLSYVPHAGGGLIADAGARQLAGLLMPLAMVLIVAAQLPGHLRRWLRHPMLLGVLLWALSHLLANGGQFTGLLLFGSFAGYALLAAWLQQRRGWPAGSQTARWQFDVLAVLAGVAAEVLLRSWHALLFGVGLV